MSPQKTITNVNNVWWIILGIFIVGFIIGWILLFNSSGNSNNTYLGGVLVSWSGILSVCLLAIKEYVDKIIKSRIIASFWQDFAKQHKWSYYPSFPMPESEKRALMFRQGEHQMARHIIDGKVGDHLLKIFNYTFVTYTWTLTEGIIGIERRPEVHHYLVFMFTFKTKFPHLYLNNLKSNYPITAGVKISLPVEFENKFQLSAPPEYEIEALQIFTPDIMAKILDMGLNHDIELVNQKLIIFVHGEIDNMGTLERELKSAEALKDVFASILDKFSFSKVGNKPYIQKSYAFSRNPYLNFIIPIILFIIILIILLFNIGDFIMPILQFLKDLGFIKIY